MERQRVWVGFLALLIVAGIAVPHTAQQPRSSPRDEPGAETAISGRVVAIHAPHLFTVAERAAVERELLVLAPRALSPAFVGARVAAGGVLLRFRETELKHTAGWAELDERTRKRFTGRLVLVASSLVAVGDSERLPVVQEAQPRPPQPQLVAQRDPRGPRADTAPLTLRAAMLVAHLDEFAGRPVRVLHGRVVGVLQPRAFLIEPATPYLKAMGLRDRMVVLIESASLRVPAELIVGSTVTVTGVARTLVGVQVTREVPWPDQLRPEVVDRLEIRGALLATSVQTPEGTELTDRQPPAVR